MLNNDDDDDDDDDVVFNLIYYHYHHHINDVISLFVCSFVCSFVYLFIYLFVMLCFYRISFNYKSPRISFLNNIYSLVKTNLFKRL
uniref:Uncharacterized protein n=1 Tax=Glossina morsitans morsitans TaxID=37546 RepID=A0A1B0G593_GLOMM